MANLNFDSIEAFLSKCKILQNYGYIFPYELTNATFNDIDYDSDGNLNTNIKVFKVVLALDENVNTHITLAKEYRMIDAINKKTDLIDSLIYMPNNFQIIETIERIYEVSIDVKIQDEIERHEDFDITYSNVANLYEVKIMKDIMNSESETAIYDSITEYNWVLINQSNGEVVALNETTFRPALDNLSVIIETTSGTSYTLIVEKRIEDYNILKSVIINS